MPRLRLYDCINSRLPELVGLCKDDTPRVASMVNSAQRRLLMCREAGDEGWWGTWAEVAVNGMSASTPYVTFPREVARVEKLSLCSSSIPIQNQFYEYLQFGNGRMPRTTCCAGTSLCVQQMLTRNNAVTFRDLTPSPQIVRIYPTAQEDIDAGRRVLLQGKDDSGNVIYSIDGLSNPVGQFVNIDTPFTDSPMNFSWLSGVQKDITVGQIQIFQVDPTTGAQVLLLTMEPGETVAGYRRYYLSNLPAGCCQIPPTGSSPLQVTAIVKLELIPVVTETDYCLLQNLEAIIEECQSIRYSEIDSESAKKMAQERHLQAVRYLQGELVHYCGKDQPAVVFAPFGSARLEHHNIGTLL